MKKWKCCDSYPCVCGYNTETPTGGIDMDAFADAMKEFYHEPLAETDIYGDPYPFFFGIDRTPRPGAFLHGELIRSDGDQRALVERCLEEIEAAMIQMARKIRTY